MFVPLLLISAVLLIYFIYAYFFKAMVTFEKYGIPHISALEAIKNTLDVLTLRKVFFESVKEAYNKFPDARYFGGFMFGHPALIIRDHELVKKITVKDFDHFLDHNNFFSPSTDDIFNKNLFSMKGSAWREMRATLSPAFTSSKMRNMFVFMEDCAQNFVKYFTKMDKDLIEVEMRDVVTKYTNDVIASASFGVECDSISNPENEFYKMGTELTGPRKGLLLKFFVISFSPAIAKVLNMSIFPKNVGEFFLRIVRETIKAREEKNIIRPDMIHLLMQARKGQLIHETTKPSGPDAGFATVEESDIGKQEKFTKKKLTDDDIAAQALVFFFAGFENIASAMSFMAFELAKNPEIQKKMQQEIDEVVERSGENVSYEDITSMKYLDQVVSETFRKWTPGFQTDRICAKDYVIQPEKPGETPYVIKKGDLVIIPTIGFHYDPKYFPNPDRFDPDRFSDENKHNILYGSYLPFGNGPRNCIGSRFALLEIKTLAFHILAHFDLVFTEKTKLPMKLKTVGFNMRPDGGFQMGLKRRKPVK